jgi:hypothetical protein
MSLWLTVLAAAVYPPLAVVTTVVMNKNDDHSWTSAFQQPGTFVISMILRYKLSFIVRLLIGSMIMAFTLIGILEALTAAMALLIALFVIVSAVYYCRSELASSAAILGAHAQLDGTSATAPASEAPCIPESAASTVGLVVVS